MLTVYQLICGVFIISCAVWIVRRVLWAIKLRKELVGDYDWFDLWLEVIINGKP